MAEQKTTIKHSAAGVVYLRLRSINMKHCCKNEKYQNLTKQDHNCKKCGNQTNLKFGCRKLDAISLELALIVFSNRGTYCLSSTACMLKHLKSMKMSVVKNRDDGAVQKVGGSVRT